MTHSAGHQVHGKHQGLCPQSSPHGLVSPRMPLSLPRRNSPGPQLPTAATVPRRRKTALLYILNTLPHEGLSPCYPIGRSRSRSRLLVPPAVASQWVGDGPGAAGALSLPLPDTLSFKHTQTENVITHKAGLIRRYISDPQPGPPTAKQAPLVGPESLFTGTGKHREPPWEAAHRYLLALRL